VSEQHDLENGWSYSFFTEKDSEQPCGLIISGPCAEQCKYKKGQSGGNIGMCGGSINFTNSTIAQKEGRSMWTVSSWEPLTLTPSILCGCGGQHGHITNGKYVSC
jgi:hypothetical protein